MRIDEVRDLDGPNIFLLEPAIKIGFTSAGEAVASRIAHRHELLTAFLRQLGLPEAIIAHDVEGLEHHVSGETFRAIERLSQYLQEHPEVAERLRK